MKTDQVIRKMESRCSALENTMNMMLALLEAERDALLKADAAVVAEMALEKQRLSGVVTNELAHLDMDEEGVPRLFELSGRLDILARENHVLIKQMFMQYRGVADLLQSITGQTNTYERNGRIKVNDVQTRAGTSRQGGVV